MSTSLQPWSTAVSTDSFEHYRQPRIREQLAYISSSFTPELSPPLFSNLSSRNSPSSTTSPKSPTKSPSHQRKHKKSRTPTKSFAPPDSALHVYTPDAVRTLHNPSRFITKPTGPAFQRDYVPKTDEERLNDTKRDCWDRRRQRRETELERNFGKSPQSDRDRTTHVLSSNTQRLLEKKNEIIREMEAKRKRSQSRQDVDGTLRHNETGISNDSSSQPQTHREMPTTLMKRTTTPKRRENKPTSQDNVEHEYADSKSQNSGPQHNHRPLETTSSTTLSDIAFDTQRIPPANHITPSPEQEDDPTVSDVNQDLSDDLSLELSSDSEAHLIETPIFAEQTQTRWNRKMGKKTQERAILAEERRRELQLLDENIRKAGITMETHIRLNLASERSTFEFGMAGKKPHNEHTTISGGTLDDEIKQDYQIDWQRDRPDEWVFRKDDLNSEASPKSRIVTPIKPTVLEYQEKQRKEREKVERVRRARVNAEKRERGKESFEQRKVVPVGPNFESPLLLNNSPDII
ncbi:hypothetical protein BLNAU_8934 [Blattamonas nauphoetae]|uniref:Uncharacterized protein n=1 Tax=Blattamonas nauphoetae TaxID=2049346 RepID=A0ABQ9XXE8_9EUKA|nr:hypothetical protein BLNAU_8934 [Blattamonas nauphoetae]